MIPPEKVINRKEYNCEICGSSFTYRANFVRHQICHDLTNGISFKMTHTGYTNAIQIEHTCGKCGAKFKHQDSIELHEKYNCPFTIHLDTTEGHFEQVFASNFNSSTSEVNPTDLMRSATEHGTEHYDEQHVINIYKHSLCSALFRKLSRLTLVTS